MNKEDFYHTLDIKQAKSFFADKGWLPLYRRVYIERTEKLSNWHNVLGYLVDPKKIKHCLSTYTKDINVDESNAVFGDYSYSRYSKEGFEPLVIIKDHHLKDGIKKRINIAEELIFYFNLYEEFTDELNKTYSYIHLGEKEPVIKVSETEVKIKQKYLLEYIAIKKKHFVMSFQFESEVNMSYLDELNFKIEFTPNGDIGIDDIGDNYHFNSLVRPCMHLIQSWQNGKISLKYGDINTIGCHWDREEKDVNFICGYDNTTGQETEISIKEDRNKNWFVCLYFRKSVLDKYYQNPDCEVKAMHVSNRFFSLKCDNNNKDYVAVFFAHLQELPYEELLHWKSHNIAPEEHMKLSASFYETMIEGKWSGGAETPDLFFKERFSEFSKLWKKKFHWELFKPLSEIQQHLFNGLHTPTSENISVLVNQIEALALILIDSLNLAEISKNITIEEKDTGITKFDKYLEAKNCNCAKIIEFLRNLQSLRSGITSAHRFSERKSRDAKKAMKHFEIKEDMSNCIASSDRLFMDSIFMLNTLIYNFELDNRV